MSAHGYGWLPQPKDPRDLHYVPDRLTALRLPASVSLRDQMPPLIWDQGQLGSCTAHGVGAVLENAEWRNKLGWHRPSRLFIYYNERAMEGTVNEDAGANIRDGIKTANVQGAPQEAAWPYDISKFKVKPPATAYARALKYTALTYHAVTQDNTHIQTALADNLPVVFGFTVYESFESDEVASTGIVPMPAPNEQILGGHCVAAIGYKRINNRLYYECRNSWSDSWGDAGHFWLPAAFMTSADASDFWVIDHEGSRQQTKREKVSSFLKNLR